MPEKITEKVKLLLTEEKWTRATLNDYVVGNFRDFDALTGQVTIASLQLEAKKLCEEHLENNKNSIVALYISGVIALEKQHVDDSHLMALITIFGDHHKWRIVEYLCQRILHFGENKDALRTLAETFEHLDERAKMFDIWKRLIKVDYSEAEIAHRLAESRENDGDMVEAITYYRKTIHRYVNKNMFGQVRDIWQKLVTIGVDDYEFFFLIEKKVAKLMSRERAITLLESLYPAIKEREKWDTSIDVLKRILNYDSRNNWARLEIIQCYKAYYSNHSQLEEYLRLSNLNQNWRNVIEAIADFEKHISFDEGNFVYHKTWGVGIIKKIQGDDLIVDFTKKREHSMSLKMAVGALQSLMKNHIWVLKSIHARDKLKAKIKSDIPWTLKTVIKSFNNVADMKKIKNELQPSVFTPSEWTNWSSEARKILRTDPVFGNLPDKLDQFLVRDKPMTLDEKTFNQFRAESKFFGKIQVARDFLEGSDPDSEFFAEMLEYFIGLLKVGNIGFQVVASYLFIQELRLTYPFIDPGIEWNFEDLWNDLEYPVELFAQLADEELRIAFLQELKKYIPEWHQVYLELLPIHPSEIIIENLLAAGFEDELMQKIEEIVEHFRERRESFLWLGQYVHSSFPEAKLKISSTDMEKILINMIRLMALTYNDIDNKRDVAENRKINRQIHAVLFKDEKLKQYLQNSNKNSAARMFTLLDDVSSLDPSVKLEFRSMIQELHPDITFYGDVKSKKEPAKPSKVRYFYSTLDKISEKQRELNNLVEIEIPKNSKEIGFAIELGDLSENAEYKAAKEKQEALQIQAGKLKDALDRVRIFPKEELTEGQVGFGTQITLEDLIEGGSQDYTIFGPWESEPSARTISYLSPFGSKLMGKKIGNTFEFDINDRHYKFTVKDVVSVN